MENAKVLLQTVDKSQLPPLHQKRVLAFVNHFLISSCSFLNDFVLQCEGKFIEVERKLQKVEAALTILEAKLASIPSAENAETSPSLTASPANVDVAPNTSKQNDLEATAATSKEDLLTGTPASEHEAYRRFFKMLQVGVPLQAVKLKMQAEGMNPDILDNPKAIVAGDVEARSTQ